jgi:NADH-quinone oxidoreductase subunit F
MDLRFRGAAASDVERDALDRVLGPATSGWDGAPRSAADLRLSQRERDRRHLLLPALRALHDRVGWISEGGLDEVCRRLGVPPAEAYGVASFYALFTFEPPARRVVHVCDDIVCQVRGAEAVLAQLPDSDGEVAWRRSPCLGLCEVAPAALAVEHGDPVRETPLGPLGSDSHSGRQSSHFGSQNLILRRREGGEWLAGLRRAVALGSEGSRAAVAASGLAGRGGAAFPTGRKWDAVAAQPGPRYVVANADESEPGTFKDRMLLEVDPDAVVEGMVIAGLAVGAEQGIVYLRGEYPLVREGLHEAVGRLRTAGALGDDVLGSGARFDVDLRQGAGAYICGEETALFASIEGYRGEPRSKPPFPVERGLFGRPTAVNNVETLVVAREVLAGRPEAAQRKVFCVSGRVRAPGAYEVPFGTSLRALVAQAGPLGDVTAVLLGGAAGSFVTAAELDVALDPDAVRAVGATLGSGVVLVLDDTVDLVRLVLRIAAFFRDESCGQCVPCRVGTVRQEELLHRWASGAPRPGDRALLDDLAAVMRDASICGLGQTAPNAVLSAVDKLGVLA